MVLSAPNDRFKKKKSCAWRESNQRPLKPSTTPVVGFEAHLYIYTVPHYTRCICIACEKQTQPNARYKLIQGVQPGLEATTVPTAIVGDPRVCDTLSRMRRDRFRKQINEGAPPPTHTAAATMMLHYLVQFAPKKKVLSPSVRLSPSTNTPPCLFGRSTQPHSHARSRPAPGRRRCAPPLRQRSSTITVPRLKM